MYYLFHEKNAADLGRVYRMSAGERDLLAALASFECDQRRGK